MSWTPASLRRLNQLEHFSERLEQALVREVRDCANKFLIRRARENLARGSYGKPFSGATSESLRVMDVRAQSSSDVVTVDWSAGSTYTTNPPPVSGFKNYPFGVALGIEEGIKGHFVHVLYPDGTTIIPGREQLFSWATSHSIGFQRTKYGYGFAVWGHPPKRFLARAAVSSEANFLAAARRALYDAWRG